MLRPKIKILNPVAKNLPKSRVGVFRRLASRGLRRYLPLTLAVFGVLIIGGGYLILRSENPQAEAAWYNSSWTYRKPITVDKNKVVGGGTLTYSSDKITGGTASGRDEANSPGPEKPSMAADENDSTKWLQFKTGGTPFWWQYDFGSGVAWKIAKYSITTANDSEERDPKTWTLLGSNTGSFTGEEVTIDTIADGALSASRGVTKEFTIASPPTTAYRYYRISISDLKNLAAANSTQVAEFRMYVLDSDGVTLSDFPMLVNVTDSDLKYTGSGGLVASSTGADILFTSSDGSTKLNHQIEKYSSTTGETIVWVKIPTLSSTADTTIYMYFGNSGASDQQNATSTWNSNFGAVYHLKEIPTTNIVDSTTNANTSASNSNMVAGDQVTGQIGGAISFNSGSNGSYTISSSTSINLSTNFSVSGWFKMTGEANARTFYTSGTQTNPWLISKDSSNRLVFTESGIADYTGTSVLANGTWRYFTVVKNGDGSSNVGLYIDGILDSTHSAGTVTAPTGNKTLGAMGGAGAIIDEFRIANTALSLGWLKTEYNNQFSPSSFYAYGKLGKEAVTSFPVSTAPAGPGWYDSSWTYRKPITLNPNQLSTAATSTFSNFPLLISVTDTDLKASSTGGFMGRGDGKDILFTSSNGTTKLSHEIEKYSSTTGETIAWVQIPTMASTTQIFMYFGNSAASDQQAVTSTWDANYKLVSHWPNGTTLTATDSTSNNSTEAANAVTAVAGQIDGAASFNGSSSYITATSTGLNITGNITVEAWIKPTSATASGNERIIAKSVDLQADPFLVYGLYRPGNTTVNFAISNGVSGNLSVVTGAKSLIGGAWTHVVGVYNGSTMVIYMDGENPVSTARTTNPGSNLKPLVFGADGGFIQFGGSDFYNGVIDEPRISNSARSADWIKTEYNNQASPSTFYSYGKLGKQQSSTDKIKSQGTADNSWYNASWTNRKLITINPNQLSTTATTTFSNFPMLFSITDSDLKYTGSGGKVASSTGADILFTASNGTTKLYHEIEKYASTTGETIAWVQIPTLASTTSIYIYFGNSGASAQQAATTTWESNFRSVWHSSETSGTALVDSTSNALNGTKLSATEPNPTTSGKIGGADAYDGNNDNVIVSDTTDPTAYTISAWVRPTLTTNQGIFLRTDSGGPGGSYSHQVRVNGSGQFESYLYDGATRTVTGSTVVSASTWYYVTGVATNSGNLRLYLNGVEEGTTVVIGTMWTGGDRYYIGAGWAGLASLSGIIDEVRLSTSVRSVDWIKTEYNNQLSPSTFYALSALQANGRQDSSGNTVPTVKARGGVKFR